MVVVVDLFCKFCLTPLTPWTLVCWAPLSMEFPRLECWGRFPFPFPGDCPDPGIEPGSPALQEDGFFIAEAPGRPNCLCLAQ